MNDEERTIAQEIEELYERQQKMNYYEMLKLTESADAEQIRRAFRKLVAIYHPDRCAADLTPELRDKLISVFDEIKKAYETLSDLETKLEYDQQLRQGIKTTRVDPQIQTADVQYHSGLEALKENDITRAIEFFKSAIEMNSQNPEYFAKLALAQMSHPRWRNEALETANKALKINPENANYYALIGRIYQKMDNLEQAEIYYNRALGWEPQHRLARQELINIRNLIKSQRSSRIEKVTSTIKGFFKKMKPEKAKRSPERRPQRPRRRADDAD